MIKSVIQHTFTLRTVLECDIFTGGLILVENFNIMLNLDQIYLTQKIT